MALRELAKREADGILVRLLWNDDGEGGCEVVIRYHDERRQIAFTVHPPSTRALDAFYHPNAYARDQLPSAA